MYTYILSLVYEQSYVLGVKIILVYNNNNVSVREMRPRELLKSLSFFFGRAGC